MNRYNSYKETDVEWIGEIPEEWNLISIKHLVSTKITDGPHETPKWEDKGIPFLSVESVQGNKLNFNKKRGYISPELHEIYSQKCKPQRDDIFIVKSGSTTGKSTIVETDEDFNIWSPLCIVRSDRNKVFPKFIFNSIQSYYFRRFVELEWSFGTQPNIGMGVIENIPLVIPSLSEQKQIVSFLDKKISLIDSLIEKTQKKIDLLKEQRTTLINEVVTKGLNPNVEFKDSGVEWIGGTPSHWILIRLHTLVTTQKLEFQDGNHGGLHPVPEEFMETGVPFIKPKDIQNESVLWSNCDRLPLKRCEEFRIGFSYNDDVLLVNRGGSIGKVVYVNNYDMEYPYFVINPQVTYMRGKNGLSSKFMFYISLSNIFRCGVDLILGHGSTFPFLGLSNMGDFEMVLPPPIEQQEIVNFLDKKTILIDSTISIEEKRIQHLKEYRQSLISEVVTGKIKVTD